MDSPEPLFFRSARWLTFGSAVAILFSIAASQILLGLALAALLLSGGRMRPVSYTHLTLPTTPYV